MLLPKDPKSLDEFPVDFNVGEPYVMFPGTSGAHLMIPVEKYYMYQDPRKPLVCCEFVAPDKARIFRRFA